MSNDKNTGFWGEENENVVTTMWHWGHSARDIAEAINATSRNAVIGKAHRMNLTGEQGFKIGTHTAAKVKRDKEIDEVVSVYSGNPYDPSDQEDQIMAVIIAGIRYGLDEDVISKATGLPAATVGTIINAMDETKCWERMGKPPAKWWHHEHGGFAMMLDVMVINKEISFIEKNGERHYFLDEAQKSKVGEEIGALAL